MAAMAMALRVVVPPHPLIGHWLSVLRDQQTPPPLYATAMGELGRWLTYEALRDWLPHRPVALQTPLASCEGQVVDASVPLLALVCLRAGLGLWQGAQAVVPAAMVGHLRLAGERLIGLDLPDAVSASCGVLLFWPELAEPEPLLAVLDHLASLGVGGARLRLITAVAARPALHPVGERHGDLSLYCGAIDPDLDGQGRIVPGLGPIAERLFGFAAAD
jgi:uracil phosphoribosyltransferase